MDSKPYIVQLGDVGAGKSAIVDKLTGENRSSSASQSVTLSSEVFESFNGELIIADTPGSNAMKHQFKHNLHVAHALNFAPVTCILIVVKADTRMDNVVEGVSFYAQRFIPEDLPIELLSVCVTHMDKVTWGRTELLAHLKCELGIETAVFVSKGTSRESLQRELLLQCANKRPVKLHIDGDLFLRMFHISDKNLKVLRETRLAVQRFEKMKQDFYRQKKLYSPAEQMDMTFEFQNWMFNETYEAQKTLSTSNKFSFFEGENMANEAGHIANMTNQLRSIIRDIRVEAAKYHKDVDTNFRKCPHCGAVWQKIEGCDGDTTCGNRPSTALDLLPNGCQKMFTFEFKWDIGQETLLICKTMLGSVPASTTTKRAGHGAGCGQTINWSAMAPVRVPVEFDADLQSTKDVSPVPPAIRSPWRIMYDMCLGLLPRLTVQSTAKSGEDGTDTSPVFHNESRAKAKQRIAGKDLDNNRKSMTIRNSGESVYKDKDVEAIVNIMKSPSPQIDIQVVQTSMTDKPRDGIEYKMTETRGRALIITNKCDAMDQNGNPTWREGSEYDHENMTMMWEKYGFVVSGEFKNYTAKEIIEAIHRETQLINQDTGKSVYADLGVFVLVISTHGSEGMIAGSDGKSITLSAMYKLLSPKNFPAMEGKPKVIILQSCSGVDRDMMREDGDSDDSSNSTFDSDESDSIAESLLSADLFIMQASFYSYASFRNKQTGSYFLRALVAALSKYGHLYHIEILAEMTQRAVSEYSVERTENKLAAATTKSEGPYVGQMPVYVCTFTGGKKLYFNPGVNMRRANEHPKFIRHAEYRPRTHIKWSHDQTQTLTSPGTQARKRSIVTWTIENN